MLTRVMCYANTVCSTRVVRVGLCVHIFVRGFLPMYESREVSTGTWGSLNFDISIASYTITPFSFFFSLLYATGVSVSKGTLGAMSPSSSGGYWQIRWDRTGGPICLAKFFFSSPRGPCATIGSTGGDTVQFLMV